MNNSPATAPCLAFKPHLTAEVVPDEGAYLVSERGVSALRGTGVTALVPLLDGTRTRDQVIAEASAAVPEQTARTVLDRLDDAGLLAPWESACQDRASELAFWELAGMDAPAAVRQTRAGTVGALAARAGAAEVPELADALRAAGLRLHSGSGRPELAVVVCDDYLDPALAEVDAAHRAAGTPWLLVRTGGDSPWIGPVFRPGETACWHCAAHQLRRNRPAEAHVDRSLGRRVVLPRSSLAAGRALGLHLAALEAVKWLAGYRYPGQDAIWTLDSLGLNGRRHPLGRRPQCPSCGTPDLVTRRTDAPFVPRSRAKADQDAAGDRALTPAQVMAEYGHLVDPLTGVVKEIRRDRRGPEFLNCFHAGHNPVARPRGLSSVRAGLRSHSSGKGTSELNARVSALCEALERHSGYFQGDEPTLRASWRELSGEAVHPDTVQLFHPRQFADREQWNAAHAPAHRVPEPFDQDAPLDWTPVWSLTANTRRLLPTALLYYDAPGGPGARSCLANSNGSAAGSSAEDALVQGFLELVERDAVALWWYNRTRQPGLDLGAFGDAWVSGVRDAHARLGREVWVLDLTSDLGIPVFAALSRRTGTRTEDISLGFGAHFDPRIALRRAVAELNQMLPPVVSAPGDGTGYACDEPAALDWWRTATVDGHPYLVPDPRAAVRAPGDFVHHDRRPDLLDDIRTIEDLTRAHGLDLLVLDQTRPDLGLPVVKVIVPGLRSFWARFGPGRLYDVPVRLGRLDTPIRYEDLNPVPLFL
ncbi:ribosomal protein S12 methylthiotransferase accessory factor [Streptomyces sp. cf386]|uniref:TOMM precursor leader peptide-binding protein n=1 Tax=Streptomyces sp. cf386 TaxID=1761904 RepID=UPI00088762EF|nr:TOMM precursor leader peptide-binding protein [Streptomyces sp. cf386]SDP00802.1 ribosomal protein S12 methylthiotransferase accessory factor [Streptomyces sp. cf386]